MPRSRGTELSQRASTRAPLHLKTIACSDANGGLHQRPGAASSPKLDDRRSPRCVSHEKKRGTQVADLETKLKKAQEELKKLREQLTSAESAKTDAQAALEEAKKRVAPLPPPPPPPPLPLPLPLPLPSNPAVACAENTNSAFALGTDEAEEAGDTAASPATDVFEVVEIAVPAESDNKENVSVRIEDGDDDQEEVELEEETEKAMMIFEKDECGEKKRHDYFTEAAELREKVSEKEKEIEVAAAENAELKKAAEAAGAREAEMRARIKRMEEELRDSRERVGRFVEEVEAAEGSKEAAEAEVRRLKVQSEQWRKAAEAAAAMLATIDEGAVGQCVSMDKHHISGTGGGGGGWGSPAMAIGEEAEERGAATAAAGKRRGAGMRMLGELWRKKGQK